ncbi:unnamed protein product, partial [Trichogramma brassicae]
MLKFDYRASSLQVLLTHNDPQVLERQERAQPACVPLSYVLRFLTDAARRENALTAVAAQQASKALSVSSLGSSSTSSCLSSASYATSGPLGNPQQLQQPQTQHLLLQQQLQQPSQLHAQQQQQQQQPPQRMVKTLVPASGISNATAGASDDDEDDADNNEDDDDDDEDDEDMIECDDEDDDDEEDDEVEDCASNDSWITARSNFERSVEQRQHFQHNDYTSSNMRYNPAVAKKLNIERTIFYVCNQLFCDKEHIGSSFSYCLYQSLCHQSSHPNLHYSQNFQQPYYYLLHFLDHPCLFATLQVLFRIPVGVDIHTCTMNSALARRRTHITCTRVIINVCGFSSASLVSGCAIKIISVRFSELSSNSRGAQRFTSRPPAQRRSLICRKRKI